MTALEVAPDGLAGIEKAIETVPDIVITDVMMPRADGLELCSRLKNDERTSHIPIIMLTAKASIEDRIAGLERGADAYLAKPFHKQELLVEIRKLLDIRKRLQQRYATFSPPAPAPSEVGLKMDDAFVRKTIEAIHEQLSEEGFGPDGLAGKLFISRSQLHRKLSALTGLSASHFIRSVRLKKALEMLQQGSTVSETALTVGFSDLSYFSKVFKEEFGKSPSKMKKS